MNEKEFKELKESVVVSRCGIDCGTCSFKEKMGCKGCVAMETPFWGECSVKKCCESKGIQFCGECGEIPCDMLKKFAYDENQGDHGVRIENCQKWKKKLVVATRDGIDSVSVCGHHCDYCFMGQWCGGCRSCYNGCSLATMYPDKVCPNVSCSGDKGLDGCFECSDLLQCKKGYYQNENEYIAKASAIYIHKYGKQSYTNALKNAIAHGVDYPKTFDESGSVADAVKILERYMEL